MDPQSTDFDQISTSYQQKQRTFPLSLNMSVGLVKVLGGLLCYKSLLRRHQQAQFERIFVRAKNSDFFYNTKESEKLRMLLASDNPSRIIWISGRASSGKSTMVQKIIQDRKYSAQLSLKTIQIKKVDQLNEQLSNSFQLHIWHQCLKTSFFDIVKMQLQQFIPIFTKSVAVDDYETKKWREFWKWESLSSMLDSIKNVLEKANNQLAAEYKGNNHPRPVLFIDEIENLNHFAGEEPDSYRQFLNWLVQINNHFKYAQVVVASSDGLVVNQVQQFIHPSLICHLSIPNLNQEEVQDIIQKGNWIEKDVSSSFVNQVGGYMGHLKQVLNDGEKGFQQIQLAENFRLSQALQNVQDSYYRNKYCYEVKDFKFAMQILDQHEEIKFIEMQRKGVRQDAIVAMVKKNYLYYCPDKTSISAINPMFLNIWRETKSLNQNNSK